MHWKKWAEESRVPRWVDDCIVEQSTRIYHKANNARGSDYVRTVMVESGSMETWEEHARDTNYA